TRSTTHANASSSKTFLSQTSPTLPYATKRLNHSFANCWSAMANARFIFAPPVAISRPSTQHSVQLLNNTQPLHNQPLKIFHTRKLLIPLPFMVVRISVLPLNVHPWQLACSLS